MSEVSQAEQDRALDTVLGYTEVVEKLETAHACLRSINQIIKRETCDLCGVEVEHEELGISEHYVDCALSLKSSPFAVIQRELHGIRQDVKAAANA